MASGSKLAVGAAIAGNTLVMVAKFIAFGFTGSAAMLSEGLHSVADVANQVLLMVGIVRADRDADRRFPFGYGAERHVWALMSAVGIFFLGAGVTVYHGVQSLLHPHPVGELRWAVAVLVVSGLIEGYVLFLAARAVRREAAGKPFWRYLRREADPSAAAVVLEDSAACLGIGLALGGIGLTSWSGDPRFDAVASILIGVLLGAMASWLIARNHDLLVGPAIPRDARERIARALQESPVVEKVVRLRTRQLDVYTYRVAADVEFAGEAIAARLEDRLEEAWAGIDGYDDFRAFAATYADAVIEQLGDEVDAIEEEIRRAVPRARFLDIEAE